MLVLLKIGSVLVNIHLCKILCYE